MFQNLSVKDLNNVHLVCRNLHQIANLHVNPKLCFNWRSPKDLESLVQSSRVFKELEFLQVRDNSYLLDPEKFELIEDYIKFTAPQIKKIAIRYVKGHPSILQQLINLLPNLEALDLVGVNGTSLEQLINWDIKSTNIKRIKMFSCYGIDNILASLEKCAIEELELEFKSWSVAKLKVLENFVKAQEKNLKKLIGTNCDLSFLVDLKDLRLHHLEYRCLYETYDPSLAFLQHQVGQNAKFSKI
jgi:hypothetical protein